ncbi:serine dehydratase [Advenella kashmirensis W13003]|uniref:L-serine dehydratase n=1 Tax=Advenella kashmirensis W13003 TaxID=1424334 RepID=V8QR61_9BURK|nr:L-serine ammonia-lyase [Advenella kashmirensis]ETF02112.1 serine dehydratase [Advenella kashmirensis W13003]
MSLSIFDIFKVGIGPSSSHTVGPMIAALRFANRLDEANLLHKVARIHIEMFGSLGATGKGHKSDMAVIIGLHGYRPETLDPDQVPGLIEQVRSSGTINLLERHAFAFDESADITFNRREVLPQHPNGMRFRAFDAADELLMKKEYYSIGGGFVMNCDRVRVNLTPDVSIPYPFDSGQQLLDTCARHHLTIAGLMMENEKHYRPESEVRSKILDLWAVMKACVARGCSATGTLPGFLNVKRRARQLHERLCSRPHESLKDPLSMLDWVNLYAMAVNEENAASGKVVTAPTNGAAGVIPAVLHYYVDFIPGASEQGVIDFLLTAAAIGILYKENASISGAEVGCQGEVGVACSMAAGALAAVLGGTVAQVENAAEIGMEHNLGMTCDPVGGMVQIPCIERNAMGAVKAINAARMALRGDGTHYVSLDKVIRTMMQTGADMKSKYKETSRGGLAVNVIEC